MDLFLFSLLSDLDLGLDPFTVGKISGIVLTEGIPWFVHFRPVDPALGSTMTLNANLIDNSFLGGSFLRIAPYASIFSETVQRMTCNPEPYSAHPRELLP